MEGGKGKEERGRKKGGRKLGGRSGRRGGGEGLEVRSLGR